MVVKLHFDMFYVNILKGSRYIKRLTVIGPGGSHTFCVELVEMELGKYSKIHKLVQI